MGSSAAETVKEIEQTRDRLDSELRELEDRLPAPAVWTKRLIGVAVGGGLGGTAFWFAVKRLRGRRKKAKAAEVVQPVMTILPERWSEALGEAIEDGRARQWAAVAGGVWVLLRLAELRQLRRMNRALVVSSPRL